MDTFYWKNLNAVDTLLRGRFWSRKEIVITPLSLGEKGMQAKKKSIGFCILKAFKTFHWLIDKTFILRMI